ncbi:UNVERIFIED_CONTAM: Fanconi anemia group D2 protein [Sesamum angustifolium]|uniref:Fanconi anemia group D2 protein n=1 Tax=Sesamum angustifolium TaxID=2727405 RepID=A0AAW2QAK7_9LAMI
MLSRRRPAKSNNPFVPPFAQPNKLTADGAAAAQCEPASSNASLEAGEAEFSRSPTPLEKMVSVLADAGCTLINAAGPPFLPSNLYNFRQRLDGVLAVDSFLRSQFLKGFSDYISSTSNLRRVLLPCDRDGFGSVRRESLVQLLLLVKSIQQDLLDMLLEKLPEYFDMDPLDGGGGLSSPLPLDEDIARLILNQFRWLDFLVNSEAFAEKLLQILSISPHHLKKEIIGSLAEMIGDHNNKSLVSSLEQMLQEDSSIIVPVLDSFSNLNLDDLLHDQVIMIALSCIRTIDIEHMPYLLRFLLLSAKESNARRIISQIREQLKFVGASQARALQHNELKGKTVIDNTEASILDALRSNLRFKNMLCLELLKELKSLEEPRDHKVIDIWLLALVFMSCESLQKSVEKLFKKKILEGCIQDHMFENCIHGIKDLPKDYLPTFLSLSAYLLACKEQRAQEFGIHMYTCIFDEFSDAYSRQEVYEVFILLAVAAQYSSQPYGFPIANELLMILRKQANY